MNAEHANHKMLTEELLVRLVVDTERITRNLCISVFISQYSCDCHMISHGGHTFLSLQDHQDFLALQRKVATPDPLSQLFTMFKRTASASGQ